eukprot:1246396-Rhodomonas_salina.6
MHMAAGCEREAGAHQDERDGEASDHNEALPPLELGAVPHVEEAVARHRLGVVQHALALRLVRHAEHEGRQPEQHHLAAQNAPRQFGASRDA